MSRLALGPLLSLLTASAILARPMAAPDALDLARLLIAAERQAAEPGKARNLSRTLDVLEANGVVPAEGEENPLIEWRQRLPEQLDTQPLRGRTLGAAFRRGVINPGQKLEFRQSFLAGQPAEVAVVVAGLSTFALEVIDEDGGVICRSRKATRSATCKWVPDYSGANIIKLRNEDRSVTGFVMVLR